METILKAAMQELLADGRPVVIATMIALLAWPVLAYPWQGLWSAAPRGRDHQPWWPYVAAAIRGPELSQGLDGFDHALGYLGIHSCHIAQVRAVRDPQPPAALLRAPGATG